MSMPLTATFTSLSPEATDELGSALGAILWAGDVLALSGDLGAGKTALVRGIARGLGLDPRAVSSPTFVIACEYTQAAPGASSPIPLTHIDAYRVRSSEDLESIGFDAACDGSSVLCVEWPERLGDALAKAAGPGLRNLATVTIEHTGPSERTLTLGAPGSWSSRPGWNKLAARATTLSEPRRATTCPVTGKPVLPDNPHWPFVSAQARMVDLGQWLTGRYVISRELREEDLDAPPEQRG